MPSKETKSPEIEEVKGFVDAFGVYHSPKRVLSYADLNSDSDRFLVVVEPVLVGDGNTEPKEVSKTDIYETTQSYKDETGMEGMKNLIKQGKAFPIQFMDDGKRSGDISNLPDNINDAHTLAESSKSVYDGPLTKEALENVIKGILAESDAKAKAEADKAANTDKEVSK